MRKKILKIGNSQGVLIPSQLLKMLSLDIGATFRLSVDRGKIILDRRHLDIPVEIERRS